MGFKKDKSEVSLELRSYNKDKYKDESRLDSSINTISNLKETKTRFYDDFDFSNREPETENYEKEILYLTKAENFSLNMENNSRKRDKSSKFTL
jgi:hypothetical protein